MQHDIAAPVRAELDARGCPRAAQRSHPPGAHAPGEHAGAELEVLRRLAVDPVVAEVGAGESRGVLEVEPHERARRRVERVVGAVAEGAQRKRGERLPALKRADRGWLADPIVHAEVELPRRHLRQLEAIAEADREARLEVARERQARAVAAVDEDGRLAVPVREDRRA